MIKTRPEQMTYLLKRLERTLQTDVKDAGASAATQLVERLNRSIRAASTAHGQLRGQDITNLLQEAIEEEAADKKLTQMVVALGLLVASFDSLPRK